MSIQVQYYNVQTHFPEGNVLPYPLLYACAHILFIQSSHSASTFHYYCVLSYPLLIVCLCTHTLHSVLPLCKYLPLLLCIIIPLTYCMLAHTHSSFSPPTLQVPSTATLYYHTPYLLYACAHTLFIQSSHSASTFHCYCVLSYPLLTVCLCTHTLHSVLPLCKYLPLLLCIIIPLTYCMLVHTHSSFSPPTLQVPSTATVYYHTPYLLYACAHTLFIQSSHSASTFHCHCVLSYPLLIVCLCTHTLHSVLPLCKYLPLPLCIIIPLTYCMLVHTHSSFSPPTLQVPSTATVYYHTPYLLYACAHTLFIQSSHSASTFHCYCVLSYPLLIVCLCTHTLHSVLPLCKYLPLLLCIIIPLTYCMLVHTHSSFSPPTLQVPSTATLYYHTPYLLYACAHTLFIQSSHSASTFHCYFVLSYPLLTVCLCTHTLHSVLPLCKYLPLLLCIIIPLTYCMLVHTHSSFSPPTLQVPSTATVYYHTPYLLYACAHTLFIQSSHSASTFHCYCVLSYPLLIVCLCTHTLHSVLPLCKYLPLLLCIIIPLTYCMLVHTHSSFSPPTLQVPSTATVYYHTPYLLYACALTLFIQSSHSASTFHCYCVLCGHPLACNLSNTA